MITYDRIIQMYEIANRVAARLPIYGTQVSHHLCGSNNIAIITEGRFKGQTLGSFIPATKSDYGDEVLREELIASSRFRWRNEVIKRLVPLDLLRGPAGKLPA